MELQSFTIVREVKFQIDGSVRAGEIRVGAIEFVAAKSKWGCSCSVAFINPEPIRLYGNDPLAALMAALDFLSVLIRGSEKDGLRIWWQKEGDHAGLCFPLSEKRGWEEFPVESEGKGPAK